MHRGLDVEFHVAPGHPNENFLATAIGNLAAFRLGRERGETLEWRVVRIEEPHGHRFRLVVRHPAHALDLGLHHRLLRVLADLSRTSPEEIRKRYDEAQLEGLTPVALRHARDRPDVWQDDFWNWIG